MQNKIARNKRFIFFENPNQFIIKNSPPIILITFMQFDNLDKMRFLIKNRKLLNPYVNSSLNHHLNI